LGELEGRLDAKMAEVWQRYKPSPLAGVLKWAAVSAMFLLALTGVYFGARHWSGFHPGILSPSPAGMGLLQGSAQQETSPATAASQKSATVRAKHPGTSQGLTTGKKPSVNLAAPAAPAASAQQRLNVPSQPADLGSTGQLQTAAPVILKPSTQGGAGSLAAPILPNAGPNAGGVPPAGTQQAGSTSQNTGAPPLTGQPVLPPPIFGSQSREGNALRVSIETQKTQDVTVNVLDSNGLLVRELYQGSWDAGVHQVDWDGKDEAGNPVLPGDYTVIVNADGKTMSGVVTVKPSK